MASPVSPAEVISAIKKAIELYQKIRDQPEVIEKIGKRMPRLQDYLIELDELIDKKKNPQGLASLRPTQTSRLKDLLEDVKTDVKEVHALLKKWHDKIGPMGLRWRFDWVAHSVYTLGSSPDKLEALHESIELHMTDITRFITLIIAHAHNAGMVTPPAGTKPKPAKPRVPSPSPEPPKRNIDVVFVDGYNTGRSKIAEAYCKLLGESTIRAKGAWRVHMMHSLGINRERAGGCSKELSELQTKMASGQANPNFVALDSVFDNALFNHPYKQAIRTRMIQRKATGLPRNLFATYDFIVVFTKAQEVKLLKLRDALAKENPANRKKGKGRIVLLGDYAHGKEIYEPDEEANRKKWNSVAGLIKPALKAFLKKETGWVRHWTS